MIQKPLFSPQVELTPPEEQVENISPLVQEAADLKTAKAEAKVESAAKVREKIAKARMTSPKTQENEPDVSFGGSGASATNPRGRGGY